ncbi:MAG TPA: glycosyltransferase family 39 protein, partial [Candidatus Sumerlaeota bacterium]|nr:glycosyltransferase family 39 protein [Candidatus Sumerlaeota bacterium]
MLRLSVGGAAGGSILLYALLVLLRIGYPFELETFEGLTADHVSRILNGLPIYVAPSVDFVSNIYPPLFYYLAAGPAWVWGVNLWVLRLVSVFASAGCLGILYKYVHRETASRYYGLLSAGFYAATYGICVGWFDVARVDSLYLFFLLAGVYGLRFQKTPRGGILTGVLLALAAFTKQTAFSAILPVLAVVTLARPRQTLWCLGTFVLLLGSGSALLDHLHEGGWYRTYV